MERPMARKWAQKRLQATGLPIAVAIMSEDGTREGVPSWSAFVTDGREEVEFTLLGRRSFTDAENLILREFPEGAWLEGVGAKGELFLG